MLRVVKKKITGSIIIPVYNRSDEILQCLSSLTGQAKEAGVEIIVVDSSDDHTPEVIQREFPEVKLIRLDKKTRPGGSRNAGVKAASGEFIIFTDSDCEAGPGWLKKGLRSLQNGADLAGGTIKNGNPKNIFSAADHLLTFREFLPGLPRNEVPFIPTCNLFCKRSDFEKIGGFREEYPLGEDSIYCAAAVKLGLQILFDPEIIIRHHNRTRFTGFASHQFQLGKNNAANRLVEGGFGLIFRKFRPLLLLLPFIRIVRDYFQILSKNPLQFPRYILYFPLILTGIFISSAGFAQIMASKK